MKKSAFGLLFSPFGITQLIMVAAIATALWLSYPPWRFERTKTEIRIRYPAVSRIDVSTVAEWIDSKKDLPVVIDVRPRAEYEFSHIPGAIHMAPSETPASAEPGARETAQFIIYDTVGSDSSAVAARLTQLAYRHVQVLDGGIFEWANRGMALDGPDGRTGKVNPGASPFAVVLKHSLRGP